MFPVRRWRGFHQGTGGLDKLIFRLAAACLFCCNGSVPAAAGIETGGLQETDKDMTCEKEMSQFFTRNCYFEKEREKVRTSLADQLAVENNDATQAQEIASRILEGKTAGALIPWAKPK